MAKAQKYTTYIQKLAIHLSGLDATTKVIVQLEQVNDAHSQDKIRAGHLDKTAPMSGAVKTYRTLSKNISAMKTELDLTKM